MKITFILPYASLSGGHRVIATYADKLQTRGHDVVVVSQPFHLKLGNKARLKTILGLAEKPNPPTRISSLDFLGDDHIVLKIPGLPRPSDIPDADIIVATWWETAEWVAAMPASKGRKFYLLQGYEMFNHLPLDRVAATFHMPLTQIAVSDYIRREIKTHHGVDGIHLVPNSVDIDHFTAPPRPKNKDLTVGFIYTKTPCKNVPRAISALNQAKQALPHLKAVAFGTLDPLDAMPIPDWVTYHRAPAERDIPGLYAQCDLWLFTSDDEGFGLPILEAMACRTPVLATAAGAAPELVNDTNGALLPFDTSAFVEAIQRFDAMSDAEWQTKSQAAQKTVERYSWEDATDLLLTQFQAGDPQDPAA